MARWYYNQDRKFYTTDIKGATRRYNDHIVFEDAKQKAEWELTELPKFKKDPNLVFDLNDPYSIKPFTLLGTVESLPFIPAGEYKYLSGDGYGPPERFLQINSRSDTYISLPQIENTIVSDINAFIDNEKVFKDLNSIYKLGLLLYGPPGEGKTSLIRSVTNKFIKSHNAVVFYINGGTVPDLRTWRDINQTGKDILKFVVIEEVTSILKDGGHETMLRMLDGEDTLDKCITILTTNYPEDLPGNIVDRPSRIDKIYKLAAPETEERKLLLEYFLSRPPTEEEVDSTKGMSTAYLKEISLTSKIKSIPFSEALAISNDRKSMVKANFKEDKDRMGI